MLVHYKVKTACKLILYEVSDVHTKMGQQQDGCPLCYNQTTYLTLFALSFILYCNYCNGAELNINKKIYNNT